MSSAEPRGDSGSAVAEFTLVGALLSLVFASVLQLGFALHVRSTVTDAAIVGARAAAAADRSFADGAAVTADLIAAGIGESYAEEISVASHDVGGAEVITVTVSAPIPVLGLLGPQGAWELRGRALAEDSAG